MSHFPLTLLSGKQYEFNNYFKTKYLRFLRAGKCFSHRGAILETTTALKSVKVAIFTICLCTAVALWYLKPVSNKKLQLSVTVPMI